MGDAGPWDTSSNIVFGVFLLIPLVYIVLGWICGISLAFRTNLLPPHHMPGWRTLSKIAWIMAIAGWVGLAADIFFSPLGLLWILTFVSPILWIVAWFQARRPEEITLDS